MKDCTIHQCFDKEYYDDNRLLVSADIIDKCNCSCKYCCNPTSLHRTGKILNLSYLKNFIFHLKNKFVDKNINMALIGGETMLHPDLYCFCKSMNEIDVLCAVFSNFSLPYHAYEAFSENVSFIISWHNDCNTKFFENFMQIPDSKLDDYIFNVMYEHDHISESIDAFNKIKQRTKLVSLRKVAKMPWYSSTYTQQQLDIFNATVNANAQNGITSDYTYRLVLKDGVVVTKNVVPYTTKNPFKHWLCTAGEDHFHIDVDGDIYPCNATIDNKLQKRGNIKYPSSIKIQPLICTSNICCQFCIKKTNVFNKLTDAFDDV